MRQRSLWQRAQRKLRRGWLTGTKTAVQAWRGWSGNVGPRLHVFVVGAQRSGTNMLMGALERSYDTLVFHERDRRAFDNYRMRDPDVIERLVAEARAPVVVIKALCEMDRLPQLMARFAPARAVWIVRHYDDMVNSSLRSFHRVPGQVAALVQDPDSHAWMGRGMSGETLRKLRELHHDGMDDASRVALFWYLRNRLLFDTGLAGDDRVVMLRYEELVARPGGQLRSLFAELGLAIPAGVERSLSVASVGRTAAPPIEPAVRAACDDLLQTLDGLRACPARGSPGSQAAGVDEGIHR